jgi:hypothetical protein
MTPFFQGGIHGVIKRNLCAIINLKTRNKKDKMQHNQDKDMVRAGRP